jgi:hypothetical protein
MPGNSFQNAQTPQSLYAASAGTLHLFSDTDRATTYDINVNPSTSWSEQDLSGQVPKGTKAVYGYMQVNRTDASAIIMVRDANSTATDTEQTIGVYANGINPGWPAILKAGDGKFEIKELSNAYEAANFIFELWGYFI